YGVYELIRKQTPLSDTKWEKLQYACAKMLKPLTEEQVNIIKGIVKIIKNQGIYALDPRKIKKLIAPIFPKGTKIEKILSAFLENLESVWYLDFHSPAFGIERFFFHIEESRSTIDEIIDFQDLNNTLLCMSNIYAARDNNEEYIGILDVPNQDIKLLPDFMKNHEQKGTFVLKELTHIKNSYRGFSIEKYAADEGWQKIRKKDLQKYKDSLKSAEREKNQRNDLLTYIPPQYNQNWQFDQHQLPVRLIKLYCSTTTTYDYQELKIAKLNQIKEDTISKSNIGLLKQLNYNKILSIGWIPLRLVYEFSLDYYWIKIPKKYSNNLNVLLRIVPISLVYLSDDEIYVWLYLTPQLKNWIKDELKWEIHHVSRYISPQNLSINWFDEKEMRWKTPQVLTT
ncbi:MAG: hypothetical protein ACW98I_20025, partial [Candidatus Hodarchaeales archaeon]